MPRIVKGHLAWVAAICLAGPALANSETPLWSDADVTGTVPAGRPDTRMFQIEEPQPFPALPAQAAPPASQEPASSTAVDESALRYFARQGDQKRLEAEIARLRALYPDWTPPADPLAVPVNVDERLEAMWQLYATGRYAEARRAIAERQTEEQGWQPPKDLLDRLAVAEAREQLTNASNLKQYDTVIRLGSGHPSLLTCGEVDVLWRVAEAFAETDRDGRARDAYRYILENCDNGQERVATMQNAARLLPGEMAGELLGLERRDAQGKGEFDPVRDDMARRSVGAGGQDATAPVSPEQLARVEALAGTEGKASDGLLLGWYYLRRGADAAAERWFRQARETEDSAEASQGLALALVARKDFAAAEAALYQWRDANDDTRSAYLAAVANLLGIEPRPIIAPDILQRMAEEVAAARDVPAGQQFGWYARAFNQFETASQWFTLALSWNADDEPSAYGLALSRQVLGDEAGLAELKRIWRGRSERIEAVGEPARAGERASQNTPRQTAQQAMEEAFASPRSVPETAAEETRMPVTAYTATDIRRPNRVAANRPAVAAAPKRGCADVVPPASLSPQAALTRGWCLMEADRPLEAAQAFGRALQGGNARNRGDAAYGQSLAYLRAGLVDDAAVAASQAPLARPRVAELQASILAERALGAFENKRYVETLIALDQRTQIAAERVDLMVLRGFAYLNLNRRADAKRVFEAAAGTGSRDAVKGLAALEELQQSGR